MVAPEQIREITSTKSYPNLNSLFELHLINLPYLPGNRSQKYSLTWCLTLAAWPILLWGNFKFGLLSVIHRTFGLATSLGDFTWYMKSSGIWWLYVLSLWFSVANANRVIIEFSKTRTKLQYWIVPMKVLENDPNSLHHDPVLRYLVSHAHGILKYTALFCGSTGVLNYLQVFVEFPAQYLPITVIHSLMTGFQGYVISAWEVNISLLLGFYLFYCARRFKLLSEQLARFIYNGDKNGRHSDLLLSCYVDSVINLCKEMNRSEAFWYPVNNIIFMGTWLAEILLLYLMFFAELPTVLRIMLMSLGFLTIGFGQTTNFIPGSYCQNKFDDFTKHFSRLITLNKSISLLTRLRSLITLEYLSERKLFYVFWSVETSTWNYIRVSLNFDESNHQIRSFDNQLIVLLNFLGTN